jgi:hypothetical protein
MAHRALNKRLIKGSVILVVAVLLPLLAYAWYVSPSEQDGVEASSSDTSTTSGEDHRRSALASLGDTAELIADATTSTTKPAPPTTEETVPPTSDHDSTGGGNDNSGEPGSTTTCPLPAYPSASCAGVPAGTKLTVHNGDLEIGQANTVIDGQDIRGCVRISTPGVVIRRSKITCGGPYVVGSFSSDPYSGTGLMLEDVEVSCGYAMHSTGVGDYNLTVRRANIHSCENGFDVDGQVVVEHSYIHDLVPYDPNNPADVAADPHSDGAQITPVGNNITFRHNTIYAGDGTSAIISPTVSAGVVSNVLITDNLMAGGAATLYCQQDGSGNNYKVINNHFSTVFYPTVGAYYPWVECADEAQVTGNVFHESGKAVPF